MIRCKAFAWSLFLWSLVFLYTIFEFQDYKTHWKVVPVITWTVSAIVLIFLLAKDAKNKKLMLLALSWSIVISIGIILKITDVIDSIALNIHISVMSEMANLIYSPMSLFLTLT